MPFTTEAIKDIFGCSPQDVREDFSPITRVILPEDLDKVIDSIEYSAKHMTIWACEYRVQIPGQSIRWILGHSTPEKLADGSITWHGFNTDITESKKAEELYLEAHNKYQDLTESISDVFFALDKKLIYTHWNKASEKLTGVPAEKALGKSLLEIFPDNEARKQVQDMYLLTIESKKPQHLTVNYPGDEIIVHEISSYPTIEGVSVFVKDVTDRKKAEKQLQETLESLRRAVNTTIQVMVSTVEVRDPYTSGHQTRSADLARAIATEMGLSKEKIEGIRMAGSIHDIGKLSIPAEILSKPTKLSKIEFALIKEHTHKGFEMLKDVESPWPLAEIVYQHHERMDGSGYPRNLKGEDICIEARILAVADVVEAMASHRPYRPGLGINAALDEIEKNRGTIYDKTVADACLRLFREKGFKLAVS